VGDSTTSGISVTTHLTLAEDGRTAVTTGDGVGASILERVPLVVFTRYGSETCFAAILEPVVGGREPQVQGATVSEEGGEAVIAVKNGEETETISISPESRITVSVGDDVVLKSGEGDGT
jgi:hypothetical protein